MFAKIFITASLLSAAAGWMISWIESLRDYYNNFRLFGSSVPESITFRHDAQYQLSGIDQKYITVSKQQLYQSLGNHPIENMVNAPPEKRLEAMRSLAGQLAGIYGMPDLKICFVYDKENKDICGYYAKNRHMIYLNCIPLMTSHKAVVKDFLDTLFHEFRHAVQWKMISTPSSYCWSGPPSTLARIADNFSHYIAYEKNPKSYYSQFVERDAREISAFILEDIT